MNETSTRKKSADSCQQKDVETGLDEFRRKLLWDLKQKFIFLNQLVLADVLIHDTYLHCQQYY